MNIHLPNAPLSRPDELDPMTIAAGVICSILLHGSILGLVILGTMNQEEAIEEQLDEKMLEFEQVELLALGETKPPEQLPRISNVKPRTREPDAVNLAEPDPNAVNLEEEEKDEPREQEEKAKDERRSKMLDALSQDFDELRPANEEIPEGAEEGVVGGLSTAARDTMLAGYQNELVGELSRNWTIPTTVSEDQIESLAGKVVVYVRLSDEGYVVRHSFKKRSGNDQFDDSISRVLKKFEVSGGGKKLPLPENPEVRAIVVREGLNLKNWEYTR